MADPLQYLMALDTFKWLGQNPRAHSELQNQQMGRAEYHVNDLRGQTMKPETKALFELLYSPVKQPVTPYSPPFNIYNGGRGEWVRE